MNTKYILLILLLSINYSEICSQELNTVHIIDWNNLKNSGFYESTIENRHQNTPNNHYWYWGINIGHTHNKIKPQPYNYGAQILFPVNNNDDGIAQMYIRSRNVRGHGRWAQVLHNLGNQSINGNLDIGGTLRAREVKIEVSAGADHVFREDYDLKPLSEVETFVRKNKHLPEIPSEKQMQEEGLSVNEFQIKLLQKIEELTLYIIEQDKKNQSLEAELNILKQQIHINP